MQTSTLSSSQVAALGKTREGHFHDRKSVRIAPRKLTRTISAFANADGGELVVGIEDDGSWAGLATIEGFNGHLQVFDDLFPYGTEFVYEFLFDPDSQTFALMANIQKTRQVKRASDGKAYIRRGASNLPVVDLAELERRKGITTHETATIKYDPVQLTNSIPALEFMVSVVPNAEPDAWLRKQGLIVDGLPTVAGTLLFHEEPQIHIPKASVKVYRYTTSDSQGRRDQLAFDPATIEGPLYDVIKESVARTIAEVEGIPVLERASGLMSVKYPVETLHEIITNAVIHRDYAINDDVHIRIFDNRIEVQSPGSLPANITAENILDERFSRNPVIVRLLNKFPDPPNKDVGEGLNTAFDAMRSLELRDPEVVDTGTSVIVLIRHESLASPEVRIRDYLLTRGTINNREARHLLNRPEADRSIRRIFEKMVAAQVIERVPGTQRGGSLYRLTEAEQSRSTPNQKGTS